MVCTSAGLGVLSLVISWIKPIWLEPAYKLLMILTIPIGLVVGELIMLVIYFGIFVPISALFKIMGRDELRLGLRKEETYWQNKTPSSVEQYYRQY